MPNDKVQEFLSSNQLEAVVIAVVPTTHEISDPCVKVICRSPAWHGIIEFEESAIHGTQRGDIIGLQKYIIGIGKYADYGFHKIYNKTLNAIENQAFAEIMANFTQQERDEIVKLAHEKRVEQLLQKTK